MPSWRNDYSGRILKPKSPRFNWPRPGQMGYSERLVPSGRVAIYYRHRHPENLNPFSTYCGNYSCHADSAQEDLRIQDDWIRSLTPFTD